MNVDVLAEWKTKKFFIADNYLIEQSGFIVILTDITYWADNWNDLTEWCNTNGGKVTGMSINFETAEQITLFALRWS